MTAVNGTTNVWVNNDGLTVKYGTETARKAVEGSPAQAGAVKVYEFLLDHADLPATSVAERFLNRVPSVVMPAGALLRKATLVVLEAFDSAGDALTLTIGLAKPDGTTIDADGIDATIAQSAIDAVGDEIACDGAEVGEILDFDACVTVTVAGADATAGRAKLIVELLHNT